MDKAAAAWPMANYMPAWRTFRRLSDEPETTADHVVRQPGWPRKDGLRILDIGCGDGRMIEAFLLTAHQTIEKVVLLDPDEHMLNEAATEIGELALGLALEPRLGVADVEGLELASTVDVGLAVHVVYLLPFARFRHLVEKWPADTPLYVVLDSADSVFTKLWKKTAPEYATRACRVHEYFAGEANGGLAITKTTFSTHVANPLELGDAVSRLVLSLVCYSDFDTLAPDVRQHVESSVRAHLEAGRLACSCTCYEISRE